MHKLLFILAFIGFSGLAQAQTFAYIPGSTSAPALDVYPVEGTINAPILVYVHGGGWMIGDKRRVAAKPAFFNALGYVFISVNYTLVPGTTVEGQLAELDQALGFIAQNAARFGGDAGRISLMGHSAGAHLVSLMALRPLPNAQALRGRGALRAVLSIDTQAYDIGGLAAAKGGLPRLYTRVFGQDRARWAALSPMGYASVSDLGMPAFLVAYSGQGRGGFRADTAFNFAEHLRASGAETLVFDGRAYSHTQINRQIGETGAITSVIRAFLAQNG